VIELPSPCLVVLVGPAGSGKSSWAREHLPDSVVSSDDLRALVGEGPHDLRASTDAFDVLDLAVERRLRRGLTTVIDSLGTDSARREQWRAIAARHGVPCIAVVFDIGAAQVRRQNKARPDRVPDAVLRTQLAGWPAVVAAVDAEPFAAVHRPEIAALVPATMRSSATSAGVDRTHRPDRRLRFGLQLPIVQWPGGPITTGERIRETARAAEEAGFDGLWMMDHLRQIPYHGPAWADILESWTTLSHLAACTERLRLGTLVTALTFRNVGHLAKIVATVDVLSGGRAECGIGLGWFADEHHAYALPFPSVDDRYALAEDALQLLPRFWGPGSKPFEGRVLRVPDTSCYPRPLQEHVPIMLGGSGERRTLRLAATYADACNLFGDEVTVARKVAVLHEHCRAVGRDPASVSVSHLSTVLVGRDPADVRALVESARPPRVSAERYARNVHAGTIDQHVARVERLAAAGVDHVIVSLAGLTATDRPAEVVGRVAAVIHRSRRV
jgi:F420-dependent oxidoreductase-like protein